MKSQNKYLEFHKVGIIGILFISIMMFSYVNVVSAKSLSIDYFIIENAYDDLQYTCAYGDYIYILNDTTLQKISLETSLVDDEIEWALLTQVYEFMRKGDRIFIDATIDALRTVICVDIESFKELAQVSYSKFSPNFLRGLENIEYYDCNDNDFWVWGYSLAYTVNDQRTYPNAFRGRYIYSPLGLNLDMEWFVTLTVSHMSVPTSGNVYVMQYFYNETSDSVSNFTWDMGVGLQNKAYWIVANSYFDYVNDTWISLFANAHEDSKRIGAQLDDMMNLQYEFRGNEQWLDVTWGEEGIRNNPTVDSDPYYIGSSDYFVVWLDTIDRVIEHVYYTPTHLAPNNKFYIARFDKSVGFITWIPQYYQNYTNLIDTYPNEENWGKLAMARLNDNQQVLRTYVAYCNETNNYPKAEWATETGGVTCVESGTVEYEFDDVVDSRVYMARLNIISIFTIEGDNDNLYVCRNLIDRGVLGTNGYTTPTLQFLDATLYTMIGNNRVENDGWLFMGEIYQLESTIQNMTYYYLELDDGQNTLRFYFNNDTKSLNITESEQFLGGLIDSSIETVNETIKQYTCTWTFILNRNIVDIQGLSITYYGYNELEDHYIDDIAITGLNIYNLGGLTYYEFNGDGGRTAQGTPFELYATNGSTSSSAKAEQIFRKLQSVHFLLELDMSNEWDAGIGAFDIDAGVGYVDIGIDYRLDGSWIEGFKVRLYVADADVGHHKNGVDADWIQWSIDFYNYDTDYDAVINLQSQYIYSNHWGYDGVNLDPDHHINRTSSQLWFDLWFDRTNASTTIATQVNSYYYGMQEHGSAWWFGYGKFQPMISEYDNAKFLDDLYDENGEISNSQKIELVKFWIKVGKVNIVDGNDETWTIRAIEDMNREQAIDRMMGVDEPTFVQTKVLDMPQTGFINALKSAINNLSVTIWLGALQFIKILMASIGYLMNAIGLGVWWESFSIMLGNIATASLAFMDELTIALLNSALLIEQIIRLISTGGTRYIYVITAWITSIIAWYGYILQMFSGGGIWSINIWTSLNLEDVFILLIHLSPVWWINRLNEADNFGETLTHDIRFMIMLVTGLFHFLGDVILISISLINVLLGMLPI